MPSICFHLGYPDDTLEPTFALNRQAAIAKILGYLDQVEEALNANILDSMATEVGDIKVNFGANINQLRLRGSNLLKQLSIYSAIPILYDRFTETELWNPVTYNRLMVQAIQNPQSFPYDRFRATALGLAELSHSSTQNAGSDESYN